MPRLYLHIGYPKTGTTSLQSYFVTNATRLKSLGVLYPLTGRMGTAHYRMNFSLRIGYDSSVGPADDPKVLIKELRDEVHSSGCDKILISSEYFVTTGAIGAVKELFSDYDTKVIVYLRRHDHAYESDYNQSVKSTPFPPWGPSIDSFVLYKSGISLIPHNYLATLRSWATIFGHENIAVRPFERSQNKPDLYSDFLRVVGIDNTVGFIKPEAEQNTSLTPKALAIIDALQRSAAAADIKREVVGRLSYIGRKREPSTETLLSPALRCAVLARYRQTYAVIAREFLGRTDGKLFDEPLPAENAPWTPPRQPSTQEMIEFLLSAYVREPKA